MGSGSWKVSTVPVASPGVRQQVSASPSTMLGATNVTRCPAKSTPAGACDGALALASSDALMRPVGALVGAVVGGVVVAVVGGGDLVCWGFGTSGVGVVDGLSSPLP